MDRFEANYRLTVADFIELQGAYRGLTKRRRIGQLVTYAIIAVLALLAGLFYANGDVALGTAYLVIGVLLLLISLYGTKFRASKQFASQRLGEHAHHLVADDRGFTLTSELYNGHQKWAAIHHVSDTEGTTILWPNDRIGWIIPKRAFATPAEADAFTEAVRNWTDNRRFP
ncbi:MAG: YcxB family protein [Pseudomonadota bacterium]